MKKTILLFVVMLFGAGLSQVRGQSATFKALFLYNFTKNVEWPPEANGEELIITVVGDSEITKELQKIAKVKKVGSKSIRVESVKNIKDIDTTHIIFLGAAKSSMMSPLNSEQNGKAVLLVADKSGLCKQGAGISFLTVDGKLRYEIHVGNIEANQLQVTKKLLSLGIQVQ